MDASGSRTSVTSVSIMRWIPDTCVLSDHGCVLLVELDVLAFSVFSFFFFQAEDGIRDLTVTGVQTCALPICRLLLYVERRAVPVPERRVAALLLECRGVAAERQEYIYPRVLRCRLHVSAWNRQDRKSVV